MIFLNGSSQQFILIILIPFRISVVNFNRWSVFFNLFVLLNKITFNNKSDYFFDFHIYYLSRVNHALRNTWSGITIIRTNSPPSIEKLTSIASIIMTATIPNGDTNKHGKYVVNCSTRAASFDNKFKTSPVLLDFWPTMLSLSN